MNWKRVNREHRCPACNHDTWCLYNDEAALCMRVASPRPVDIKGGEVGWIHRLKDTDASRRYPEKRQPPAPVINVGKLIRAWNKETRTEQIRFHAAMLGVSFISLVNLHASWAKEHNAWAWPMRDGYGNFIGIRLRSNWGKKWAVPGSHNGIFLPFIEPQETVVICEGPTDTAAALSMGVYAIGRPSCSGGVDHLLAVVRRLNIRRVVIVADNDDPGLIGATTLQNHLPVPSCVMVLPCKDMRKFVNSGGNQTVFNDILKGIIWTNK